MIPTIGLMIGVYIITRMISFVLRSGERSEHIIVKICAIFALLITLACLANLFGGNLSPAGTNYNSPLIR